MPKHSLLQRQLKRCFGEAFTIPSEWETLLERVDETYRQFDRDRAMLERTLEQSSQELLQANSELRAVSEAIPDLLFRVDRSGIVLSVKVGTETDFVIPPSTLRGKRIQDLPDQSVGKLFEDALSRVATEQRIAAFEYSLPDHGRPTYFEARLVPRGNDGTVVIVRDITGRKNNELEIARVNRLYAVLSEANQAVVRSRSPDELLAQVCRAVVEQGRFRLAWIGLVQPMDGRIRPIARSGQAVGYLDEIEIYTDATVPDGRGPAGTAYREGRTVVIEDFLGTEGEEPWRERAARHGLASCCALPIRKDGKAAGVFCVYAGAPGQFGTKEIHLLEEVAGDVSFALDHLEAEAARRRIEERNLHLAMIVDFSDDAIVSRSLDHVILTWNRGAAKIYGYTEAEMVGQTMNGLVPPDRLAEMADIDALLRRDEAIPPFETVRRRKDGREIQVAVTVSALRDASGRVIGAATVARDITAQKELAAQFLRAQRLESVGKLASGIAHDLNNILSPIMMAVPLLREKVTDPRAQSLLDTMAASVSRGAQVIRHMLVFARGGEQSKGPIQTRHLVREIADMLEQTLPKSITVQGHLPRDLWLVEADATQFHQIVMNLCVNARDAMPQGGELSLSGENVALDDTAARKLRDARPGRYVAWTVADTGGGIPPENLERIFEPFFTTKDAGKGTGLGLSTVRSLVRESAGFLDVVSRPGEGTRFRIYLPATIEPAARVQTAPPLLPAGQGETVLLVDDEFSVRQMIEQALVAHNYRVVTADSAATALDLFRLHEDEIALLLTDLIMPGMSGAELIRQLRSRNPALKVVAISGQLERTASGVSQMDIMADTFLHKPFTMEELLTQTAATLREKR